MNKDALIYVRIYDFSFSLEKGKQVKSQQHHLHERPTTVTKYMGGHEKGRV